MSVYLQVLFPLRALTERRNKYTEALVFTNPPQGFKTKYVHEHVDVRMCFVSLVYAFDYYFLFSHVFLRTFLLLCVNHKFGFVPRLIVFHLFNRTLSFVCVFL